MVNVHQIQKRLKIYFNIDGEVEIDPRTGIVNVAGDVRLRMEKRVQKLPLRFGRVSGYFWCGANQLTSLEGAPEKVDGSFYCWGNQLTSLEGAPSSVGGDFACYQNQLTSLHGAPQTVKGDFECYKNRLTGLMGSPRHVGKDFDCSHNQLMSLEGAPEHVGDRFTCTNNPLLQSLQHLSSGVKIVQTTYTPHLGVLRYCYFKSFWGLKDAPKHIMAILNKYKNQGNKGVLLAAAELIKAGYKDNARL